MVSDRRQHRLQSLIRREVEEIIRRDVSDPRVGFVSITSVKMTPDLRDARIMVSFLGNEDEQKKGFSGLKSAEAFIRHQLSRKLAIRHCPAIHFVFDERKELRIEEMLAEMRKEGNEEDTQTSG